MAPLVSVLIGVYNGERYLGEAIESALAQTYSPIEVVVVDDGSTDSSAEIAAGYPEVVLGRQANAGNGSARNHAVRLATGDLFAFMDADDRSPAGRLALQAEMLDGDPELDIVFGHAREFVSPELTPEQRAGVRPAAPEPSPWVSANLMLVRRTSFERVGPFSEELRVGVTVDWCARAVDAGLKTAMPAEVVLERRLHLWNNGIREQGSKAQYARVMKAALDRRRAQTAASGGSQTDGESSNADAVTHS